MGKYANMQMSKIKLNPAAYEKLSRLLAQVIHANSLAEIEV